MTIDVIRTVTTSLDPPFWSQKFIGEKNIRIRGNIVYTIKVSGVKSFRIQIFHFKFWIQFGFKISGDMTEPGSFHFGFVHLCVNGKTNKVLKHSGFITNPEQFPLVHSEICRLTCI